MTAGWNVRDDFDLEQFLARPLVARLATVWRGEPRVRPVWYLFDDAAFWWLTGPWSVIDREIALDPAVELVIDTCDLASHEVLQVRARGNAEFQPFHRQRALQWGERYLGPDHTTWGRFATGVFDNTETRFVRMRPMWLRAQDLSW